MKQVVFLCHGNICRSPMAEYVMKFLAAQARRSEEFRITSAAVSYEEEGNGIYPPAQRKLREEGIPFGTHRAHRITPSEYAQADLVIVMDQSNLRLLSRIVGPDTEGKVHKLLEYAGSTRDVADPWYTGDFNATYDDILRGCRGLLAAL